MNEEEDQSSSKSSSESYEIPVEDRMYGVLPSKEAEFSDDAQSKDQTGWKLLKTKHVGARLRAVKVFNQAGIDAKLYGVKRNLGSKYDLDKYLDDQAAIRAQRRGWRHPLIMPYSKFRSTWNVFITILVLPFRIAFGNPSEEVPLPDMIVDGLFAVDIIISFFSAYLTADGVLVTDYKQIAKKYISTWFILDFVGTFPFYFFFTESSASSRFSRLLRVPRLFRMLRFIRLLRSVHIMKNSEIFHKIERGTGVHPGTFRIAKLMLWVMALSHVVACVWLTLPGAESSLISWKQSLSEFEFDTRNDFSLYMTALYWAFSTLCTVGYGDVVARTSLERVVAILTMCLGITFYAYTTATVASVMHSMDLRATEKRLKMESLRSYMRGAKLPYKLQQKLQRHFRYAWDGETSNSMVSEKLLEQMPASYKSETAFVLSKTPYFFEKPDQFKAAIIGHASPVKYSEGEFIANKGDNTQDWFILKNGLAQFVSENISIEGQNQNRKSHVLMTFVEGSTFGEVGLMVTKRWECDLVAVRQCEVLQVRRKDFFKVLGDFPTERRNTLKIAVERHNRLKMSIRKINGELPSVQRQRQSTWELSQLLAAASDDPKKLSFALEKISETPNITDMPLDRRVSLYSNLPTTIEDGISALQDTGLQNVGLKAKDNLGEDILVLRQDSNLLMRKLDLLAAFVVDDMRNVAQEK